MEESPICSLLAPMVLGNHPCELSARSAALKLRYIFDDDFDGLPAGHCEPRIR